VRSTQRTPTSSCESICPFTHANDELTTSAQMDATLNDIPPSAPFKVQGFPTLKFKPAGSLEFIDYNGDRSLESLIEFVEINKRSADVEDEEEVEEEEDDVIEHDEL
jgi:protein disulfide-isomerase A1